MLNISAKQTTNTIKKEWAHAATVFITWATNTSMYTHTHMSCDQNEETAYMVQRQNNETKLNKVRDQKETEEENKKRNNNK